MLSFTCRRFWREYRRLPEKVKRRARKAYSFFKNAGPEHPSLEFESISRHKHLFSARVNDNYRVLGAVSGENEIMWFWIGPHDEYIRKINDPRTARSVEMAQKNLADRRSKR